MKHLRKFNEDVDTFAGVEDFGIENQDDMEMQGGMEMQDDMEFTSSIFNDIESDMSEMSLEEGEDYLKSIISFCNQKLTGVDDMDEDEEMMSDLEEMEMDDMEEVEESFGRIKKFR
jgi:hypothetical protein